MHNLETRYKAVVHYNFFLPSLRSVSKLYCVSKSSLQRWVKQSPSYRKKRATRCVQNEIKNCIDNSLQANPFLTIQSLTSIISKECNVIKSRRTINRYVAQQNITFKNAFRKVDNVYNNDKVRDFCHSYVHACDSGTLISIDEAGFYLGDHRKKGWCSKGRRLTIKSDKTLRRTKFTLLMAVSSKGLVAYEIMNHNCKKVDFIRFIDSLGVPIRSTILMDNIAFHHSKEVVELIKRKEMFTLYTIPYSPRLNPIENIFGMIKPLYRQQCPPHFNKDFDYKNLFERTMKTSLEGKCLSSFFDHVRTIAVETINGIHEEGDNFIFSGYDL